MSSGRVLFIAGHGLQKDGSFDPGATGYIKKGEHRYMRDDFIPAMKKFIPDGADVAFYTKKKVSNHGSLKDVAKKYGGDNPQVIELHYDAFNYDEASGGHVIVQESFEPDKLDLRIRDVIGKHVGLRFSHKGEKGISGRGDLWNPNDGRRYGINYRLVELGFGTSKKDVKEMTDNIDSYAKDFVKAVFGKVKENDSKHEVKGDEYIVKKGDTLWGISKEVNNVDVNDLKRWNNLKSNVIQIGQKLVTSQPNRHYTVKKGDTLSEIGQDLGVNWRKVAEMNGIKAPYVIHVGQKLKY